jgi:hypothetical protein
MCTATPGAAPGNPERLGPLTFSVTLPAELGADPSPARLVVGGVLDRDGLTALIHLAHVGLRRGCRELVLDVRGLTDFPSALFGELRRRSTRRSTRRVEATRLSLLPPVDAAAR